MGYPPSPRSFGITDGMAASWVVVLLGLGFAGRNAQRWAFLAGMALYLVDMMALMVLFSLWAFGIHAFFVFPVVPGTKGPAGSQAGRGLRRDERAAWLSLTPYDSKRARRFWECRTATVLASKEINSSAPNHSPS